MFVDEHADADIAVRVTGNGLAAADAAVADVDLQLTPKSTPPPRATPLRHFSFTRRLCSKVRQLLRSVCSGA